jgi:hypothetical protein
MCIFADISPRKFRLGESTGLTHHFSYGPTTIKTPNDAIHGICETPHMIDVVPAEPIRSVHGQVLTTASRNGNEKAAVMSGLIGIQPNLNFIASAIPVASIIKAQAAM